MEKQDRVGHSGWYGATIADFLSASPDAVLGSLTKSSTFDVERDQTDAWVAEVDILRSAVPGLDGWIYLEFDVPRLGSRIDAVVVTGAAVIPIEFKVGEAEFRRADIEQAWDYGLDLKNFHAASHGADLFPLLVATGATVGEIKWGLSHADGVRPPCRTNPGALGDLLRRARQEAVGDTIDGREWGRAPYRVLLTRARQGMAIFVPPGDESDPTRPPEYYDGTYGYLSSLGIPALA